MKKIVIALVAILCISLPASAKFGIKAGANISSLTDFTKDELIDHVENANSYQGGLVFQFGKGMLRFQPELLMSVKSAELYNDGSDEKLNALSTLSGESMPNAITLKESYIEVPLNLQLGIDLGDLARVYVQAGPYASLLFADEVTNEDGGFYKAYKEKMKELGDDPLNKLDYGIGIGAGVEFLFLQLAVKYDYGMAEAKAIKNDALAGQDVNLFSGMKHRNFSISLALMF